ncbi:DUF883 domain-containing protein [Paraglaciecola hydrolytica]|uniref:DUF883 domain-containing protein n=1 Tax=Paraglaciecola hydrolytica TaxID=1799789 RepID=A0A148KMJ6_9ALTE|nr:DUF883 domain-containing protein [Paraglaciecola hydrolytica]KXI27479.1 hypothetical protein AX660_22480 [Paraglaciecola hydrolytica]
MATATANTQNQAANNSGSPVTNKASAALHKTVDTLAEKAAGTEEKLRESASHSAESIAAQQKAIQDKWQNSKARNYATENPLATAGIAFAAGVLLTTLLRRS